MKITSILLMIVITSICSCASNPEHRLSGLYLNEETGGYIVFNNSGEFYYAFEPNNNEQYKTVMIPRNRGTYSLDADGRMTVITRSTHYGLFEFRLSDGGDTLYVSRIKEVITRKKVAEIFKKSSVNTSKE